MPSTPYPDVPRRTVLAVACPHCGAGQQEKCISRTGKPTYDAHSARFAKAEKIKVLRHRMAAEDRKDPS